MVQLYGARPGESTADRNLLWIRCREYQSWIFRGKMWDEGCGKREF
jgi:hypothetical protein